MREVLIFKLQNLRQI